MSKECLGGADPSFCLPRSPPKMATGALSASMGGGGGRGGGGGGGRDRRMLLREGCCIERPQIDWRRLLNERIAVSHDRDTTRARPGANRSRCHVTGDAPREPPSGGAAAAAPGVPNHVPFPLSCPGGRRLGPSRHGRAQGGTQAAGPGIRLAAGGRLLAGGRGRVLLCLSRKAPKRCFR